MSRHPPPVPRLLLWLWLPFNSIWELVMLLLVLFVANGESAPMCGTIVVGPTHVQLLSTSYNSLVVVTWILSDLSYNSQNLLLLALARLFSSFSFLPSSYPPLLSLFFYY